MRTLPLLLVLLAALALAPEPAAAQQTDSTRATPADSVRESNGERPRRRSTRGPITEEDIRALHLSNAYEVIQRLRPHWLRIRGPDIPSAAQDVMVYEDRSRRGYTPVLREMNAANIYEITFIDPINAKLYYGPGHEQG